MSKHPESNSKPYITEFGYIFPEQGEKLKVAIIETVNIKPKSTKTIKIEKTTPAKIFNRLTTS